MTRWTRLICGGLIALSVATAADAERRHLYVCRSPLLAFDFWNTLQDMHRQGVTVTSKIAQEVCDHMKAGDDRQCIWSSQDFVETALQCSFAAASYCTGLMPPR